MDHITLEDNEYEVETILEWRYKNYPGREEYKVKWKGKLVISCLKKTIYKYNFFLY